MSSKKDHIRVIISGGGTGGHIYPAIAIADTLKEIDDKTEILFVGAEGKMEMEKVPQAGYEIIGLGITGIQRRLSLRNLMFPIKLLKSLSKASQIIKEFQPDVVVGVGGYASGPLLKSAERKKVPALIQEQNGYAGLTNKWLAGKADKICVAYNGMEKYFPGEKIIFTGNPVRKDISKLEDVKVEAYQHFGLDEGKKTLLVVGGSLGALTLNESVIGGIDKFLEEGFQIIWQTGKYYYESMKSRLGSEKREGVWSNAFINRMDYAYACADVVISRAGALSISEICLVGKPVILVPSPNVAEDHQTKNAMALVNDDAAILVKDAEARDKLIDEAILLLGNREKQEELAKNIKLLGKPEAAKRIAEEVRKLAG
ncbi:MAG: undecaprenyldiphospho-muramoylpentapeptide beta-N-acetylglucosaminyltransferase [Flammeovirgaceae bacterium]|nr:undecaprenyldiphospho-muramoylpentapeptide beta-N-acetylglucosaminyltransferase [Flammeovirgaceae bacterium]